MFKWLWNFFAKVFSTKSDQRFKAEREPLLDAYDHAVIWNEAVFEPAPKPKKKVRRSKKPALTPPKGKQKPKRSSQQTAKKKKNKFTNHR